MNKRIFILKIILIFISIVLLSLNFLSYASSSEYLDKLNLTIQEKGAKWVAKKNPLSDLSIEEMKKFGGALEPSFEISGGIYYFDISLSLPPSFDWSNNSGNYVTPIRNQEVCGSCWAFASVAALESKALINLNQPGVDLDLSEQIVLSCSGAGNCQEGGFVNLASDFLRDQGTSLESCYPYQAVDGNCANACANWQQNSYKIESWSFVVSGIIDNNNINLIKNALYTFGPVIAWFKVFQDFGSYGSGIYSHVFGEYIFNHFALVVGWDDNKNALKCKNSWGTYWGEEGFFWVDYSQILGDVEFGRWIYSYGDVIISQQETISKPTILSGITNGTVNVLHNYTTGGSSSNLNHPIQYLFDWGDGTNSEWLSVGNTSASKSWASTGNYLVKSQARCSIDTSIMSNWSEALSVIINPLQLPDLTGQWNSLTQTCRNTLNRTKCSLKGKFTLQNIGNKDASPSTIKFYFSDNNTYNGGDILLKQISITTILSGESLTGNVKFNLPSGQSASGKYKKKKK
jgi:C1A family cysteine protease